MEVEVQRLAGELWTRFGETPPHQRLLIGIAGIPGSGKTTFSQRLCARLNQLAARSDPDQPPPAAFIPMDGFHLTRAALSAMPDPVQAHARRGAAFTFDAPKFLALVRALRASPGPEPIRAPSFDHAIKDPKEDDITVLPTHRILLLEGNYLALDKPLWRDAAALLDERWFIDVDFQLARRRLGQRHLRSGIAQDADEADRRAIENDLVNGQEILAHRLPVTELIRSQEDDGWSLE